MPRRKNPVPPYLRHKASGQAFVKVPDGAGGHNFVYLGKHGTEESQAEYGRILAELRAGKSTPGQRIARTAPTVMNQVLVAFLRHAEKHYRRADGTQTQEVGEFKRVASHLRRLYGHTPIVEFGPLALKAVREQFLAAGWCRNVVNARTNRIRHILKWAAGEELVPGSVWIDLRAVAGLGAGRTEARESAPVGPVSSATVHACLPFLLPPVRAVVELQLLTGMRPGEVLRLRPVEIDFAGPVWIYRPRYHKLTHLQKARAIALGPKAQAILNEFTPNAASDYYFSPRRAVEEFHARRSECRVTPVYGNGDRPRVATPKRPLGHRYDTASYRRAITRAVEKANRVLIEAAVDVALHVPHWHPNQLRHTHGTEVRRRFGLEAAQVALGHERADVTQVYAERNLDLAVKVAAEVG